MARESMIELVSGSVDQGVLLNAGRCSFEWICLQFPKGLAARRKAIFRRLSGAKEPSRNNLHILLV